MAGVTMRSRGRTSPAQENALQPLQVRFYRRMRARRTYVVSVGWKKAERGLPGKEVTLRLLAGGAQVVPAEHPLDPADPDAKVLFHVTPLGKGRVTPYRLEVLHEGRKVQEVALRSKVVSQRCTWIFLLMVFLGPWIVITAFKNQPLQTPTQRSEEALDAFFQANLPEYPKLFRDFLPGAEDYLVEVGPQIASLYQSLCVVSGAYPIAYYTMLTFLVLTSVSAFVHNDAKKKKLSPPIPLPSQRSAARAETA